MALVVENDALTENERQRHLLCGRPYGVRVIAFSSVASAFVPALLSVDSQIVVPTATITSAAIKTARYTPVRDGGRARPIIVAICSAPP